jgi:xylulokinase
LQSLSAELADAHIVALSVDSTSGTIVPLDAAGEPLMPALMYNDNRAAGLEAEVNAAAGPFTARMGYTFPPTFALVKLVWLARNRPQIVEQTALFAHASDFITGRLTGDYHITDSSNALKTGVDLETSEWPYFIERLGVPLAKLPMVTRPGAGIGAVSAQASLETGLPMGTPVIAGATDGTASFLASGAHQPGDWNITIGTTIVLRGVASDRINDPAGRFYSHRHPDWTWLPGGASNVGGEALVAGFGDRIASLDAEAEMRLPTALVTYPLVRTGERMPFVSAGAHGFMDGEPADDVERFAATVEGIALVALWSVQEMATLGAQTGGRLYLTGGGAHGKTLGRVMASAFGRPMIVPAEADAAFGSGLLAAGWAWHGGSIGDAQAAMVRPAEQIEPRTEWFDVYQAKLEALKTACRQRHFL